MTTEGGYHIGYGAQRVRGRDIPRQPDGHLDPDGLNAAVQSGYCVVRWPLPEQPQRSPLRA